MQSFCSKAALQLVMDQVDGITLHEEEEPFKECPTVTSFLFLFEVGQPLFQAIYYKTIDEICSEWCRLITEKEGRRVPDANSDEEDMEVDNSNENFHTNASRNISLAHL